MRLALALAALAAAVVLLRRRATPEPMDDIDWLREYTPRDYAFSSN